MSASSKPILIYGAGQAGRQLLAIIRERNKENVVGFLDDDKNIQGRSQADVNIYSPKMLNKLIKNHKNLSIILAIPTITKKKKNKIIEELLNYNIPINTLPSLKNITDGNIKLADISDIMIEDLLGRNPIKTNAKLLSKNITNKVVLVTGAGGSIGSELSKQILKLNPTTLILVDHSEYSLFYIYNNLLRKKNKSVKIIPKICDINNKILISKILSQYKPFSLFHAAAYKHVHLVEINNFAGINNNILGTLNIIQESLLHNVKNFTFISTDKAVRPTNLMGATKRFAELILQSLAKENKNINISIVRFGNVLGSSGSVIPIFREQIKNGGPLIVTNKKVERYFMTIPEATELVIQSSSISKKSGNIFYLDMGKPIKISDLAKQMINLSGHSVYSKNNNSKNSIKIKYGGLKPGEKLFEELVIKGESKITEHPKIFSVEENFFEWKVFKKAINKIEENVENQNIDKIIFQLEKYVEGYKNIRSKNEYILDQNIDT